MTDRFGTWLVQEDGAMRLIEESPEWIEEQHLRAEDSSSVAPTQEDFMFDLAYRVAVLEMGM